MTSSHAHRTLPSPIGDLHIEAHDGHIVKLTIVPGTRRAPTDDTPETTGVAHHEAAPHGGTRAGARDGEHDESDVLDRCETQLREYFAGARREFDLPLRTIGTPFREAIWASLRALPWGSVTSYSALGAQAGHAGASRAVGGAVGANPIPILIPCHRVLAHNNRITGYSGGDGVSTKEWLLTHEEILYS